MDLVLSPRSPFRFCFCRAFLKQLGGGASSTPSSSQGALLPSYGESPPRLWICRPHRRSTSHPTGTALATVIRRHRCRESTLEPQYVLARSCDHAAVPQHQPEEVGDRSGPSHPASSSTRARTTRRRRGPDGFGFKVVGKDSFRELENCVKRINEQL
jgi:hypothetical protein